MPMVGADETHGNLVPTMRQWHWVGDINLGARNDGYVGAKAKYFFSLKAFNKYFSDNKTKMEDGTELGMVLIRVLYMKPILFGLLGTIIVALVTNQMSPEEMEEMIASSRRIEEEMKEWRRQRDLRLAEEKTVKEAAENEVRRLARVGDHCEKNHKHNPPKRSDTK